MESNKRKAISACFLVAWNSENFGATLGSDTRFQFVVLSRREGEIEQFYVGDRLYLSGKAIGIKSVTDIKRVMSVTDLMEYGRRSMLCRYMSKCKMVTD